MIEIIRNIHITCAALSFGGFFIRGIWKLRDSELLNRRWVKIVPHIVDTLLLISAIAMAFLLRISPFQQPWLGAKIIALFLYIGIGMIALKYGKSRKVQVYAWLLGMLIFIYIVTVAYTKSVFGFLEVL